MKKVLIALLAVFTLLCGTVYAEDPTVIISAVSVTDGLVTVQVENVLEEETSITMTAVKEIDGNYTEDDKTYAFDQMIAEASSTVEFKFFIPTVKKDIKGSGIYKISVQNGIGERTVYKLLYADSETINKFIKDLNDAVDGMSEDDTAYGTLWPLFKSVDKAVIVSLGIDYDTFMAYNEALHKDMMNVLCNSEITQVNIKNTLGVSIFNVLDKNSGIELIKPQYGGKEVSSSLYSDVTPFMKNSYTSYESFIEDLKKAYGFYTINKADVEGVKTALSAFKEETSLCGDAIDKITKLTSTQSYRACKYIVEQTFSNKVKTEEELNNLLNAAYSTSQTTGTVSGGGGGGGGGRVLSTPTFFSSDSNGGYSNVIAELIFPDLSADHWAAESVKSLKEKGVISGTDSGNFEPDRAVTREEFAKMLVSICGFETESTATSFGDANSGEWYCKYIGIAADKGIVKGIGDNLFGVGQIISRQDMAVMTYNAVKAMNISLAETRGFEEFGDYGQISDYANEAVTNLFKAGIINGKGNGMFEPKASATRAEAAKIIYYAIR